MLTTAMVTVLRCPSCRSGLQAAMYSDLTPSMVPSSTLVQHSRNARSAAGGAKPGAA